jgi:hypothetical protein
LVAEDGQSAGEEGGGAIGVAAALRDVVAAAAVDGQLVAVRPASRSSSGAEQAAVEVGVVLPVPAASGS